MGVRWDVVCGTAHFGTISHAPFFSLPALHPLVLSLAGPLSSPCDPPYLARALIGYWLVLALGCLKSYFFARFTSSGRR